MAGHVFSTRRGRAFRLTILDRDLWTCQMCGVLLRTGRTDMASAAVDHVRPVELRPDLAFDEANCRAVCRACHATCDSIEKRHSGDAEAIAEAKLAGRKPGRMERADGWRP